MTRSQVLVYLQERKVSSEQGAKQRKGETEKDGKENREPATDTG